MGLSILIIDDQSLFANGIAFIFKELGQKVDTAYHCDTAILKTKNKKYDLILIDYNLRGMSGIQLFDKIKKYGNNWTEYILMSMASKSDISGLNQRKINFWRKDEIDNELIKNILNKFNLNET